MGETGTRFAGLTLRLRESLRIRRLSPSPSFVAKVEWKAARLRPPLNWAVSGRGLGGLPLRLPLLVMPSLGGECDT